MTTPSATQAEIILRPFEEGDADSFAAAVRESATTVGPWMPWCRGDYSVDEARAWFAACTQAAIEGSAFEFGVFGPDGKELFGGAGLNQFNRPHNFDNLGYWIRESCRRRGVATGAALALAKFGFDKLSLARIEIVIASGNDASVGVARKIGARFECIARNRLVLRGESVDALVFSLIPADIEAAGPARDYDVEVRRATGSARG